MKREADSSILKSLAVAFGDGLAVGVKLAQSARKKETPPARLPAAAAVAAPGAAAESNTTTQAALEELHAAMCTRIDGMERRLEGRIELALETRLLERIELLQAEVRWQGEMIKMLRAVSTGSERKLDDLMTGIHRACRQVTAEAATERGDAAETVSGGTAGSAEQTGAEVKPHDDRRSDSLKLVNCQARTGRKLPLPLVSSLAVFVLALVAAGF
jgi:hypothetical protein